MSNTADAIVVIDLQKGVCFDSSPIHELETVTALVNKRIKRGATTTYDNPFMKAKETIAFYEKIWDKRFLTFLEQ